MKRTGQNIGTQRDWAANQLRIACGIYIGASQSQARENNYANEIQAAMILYPF